jgi:hypothetical protein
MKQNFAFEIKHRPAGDADAVAEFTPLAPLSSLSALPRMTSTSRYSRI